MLPVPLPLVPPNDGNDVGPERTGCLPSKANKNSKAAVAASATATATAAATGGATPSIAEYAAWIAKSTEGIKRLQVQRNTSSGGGNVSSGGGGMVVVVEQSVSKKDA